MKPLLLANAANNVSLLRVLLVPVFVGCLIYYRPEKAHLLRVSGLVFVAACVSDGVDGYLARRYRLGTILGSYLDPLADKLLLLSGFLSLSFMEHLPPDVRIPAWVTISVVTRDGIILLGSVIIYLTTGSLRPHPLFVGKLKTVVQMATLGIVLLGVFAWARPAFFVLTTVFTVVSGAGYLRMGGRLLQQGGAP